MRISDWSSDVCSSDLGLDARALSLVSAFLAEIQKADDMGAVEALLASVAHELDFRHYAMIHHDDHRTGLPGLINMNNYPPDYAAEYFGGLYHRDDPVVPACIAANACFTWCEMPDRSEEHTSELQSLMRISFV